MKRRWAIVIVLTCGLVLLAGVQIASARSTCPSRPPINDDYLCSLELNTKGQPLNSEDTLKDVRNTTGATVQSNILKPGSPFNGPAEVTNCQGTPYGTTVWYDFYPGANGTVRIRTSGFDNVITLFPFNTNTGLPNVGKKRCVHSSSFPSEELDARVTGGGAYTFQIGGANNASGPLQMLFDYFIARLFPSVTLQATSLTGGGIQLFNVSVSTSRGAHVSVSCSGHCRSHTKSGAAKETFQFHNVRMPVGSKLQIRVTARHAIGSFIQYTVLPRKPFINKITRCTEPGSRKPRRSCH
jgi:hypothetical protein